MTKRRIAQKVGFLPIDAKAILSEKVRVTIGGVSQRLSPHEALIRSHLEAALAGDMSAAAKMIKWCRRAGLLEVMAPPDDHDYRIFRPLDYDPHDWDVMFDKHGPPPWPCQPDGLIPKERRKPHHNGYGRR